MTHLTSFAGDDARADVSSTIFQPFLAKAIGGGQTLSVNLESSYDWEGSRWTVPVNIGYSKVTRMGDQLVSWQVGARYYTEAPDTGPEWGVRSTFTWLYPRAP